MLQDISKYPLRQEISMNIFAEKVDAVLGKVDKSQFFRKKTLTFFAGGNIIEIELTCIQVCKNGKGIQDMERVQSLRNLKRKTRNSREIYLALKEDILALNLRPGQMISENEIAERYNVSRTPVKSAFTRLESEGFIEVVPQKGTFVALIDCEHIRAIIYMRYVMEADACRTIAREPCLQAILEKLDRNLAEQKQLLDAGEVSPTEFYEIDSRFHAILFEHVGLEKIWSIIQIDQPHYARFRLLDTQMTVRYDELYQRHVELRQALCERDVERFGRDVHDHLYAYLNRFTEGVIGEQRAYLTNLNFVIP